VGDLGDGSYFGAKSVLETDMGKRHDERLAVDYLFIMRDGDAIAFSAHKPHIRSPHALSQPDVTHGGKLEFSHHNFRSFAEIQSAGNTIDACRNAGHDSNFVGTSVNEARECGTCGFVVFNPALPR
jgi:hypothetical protein